MSIEIGLATVSTAFVLTKASSKDTVDFFYKWNVDEKLKSELEGKVRSIRAVLDRTELEQIKDSHSKKLLRKVNIAIYDAEDLLDEIATDVLESSIKNSNSGFVSKMKEIASAVHPLKETIETQMRNMLEKLESQIKDMERLGYKTIEKKIDYATGFVTATIYGRDLDKVEIQKLLKAGEKKEQFGVVPIVGMGGIGKTALAKMVYDANELKFDFRAWTNVTDSFDVKRIMKAIIESTGGVCNSDDLGLLQSRLKAILQGNKFLLVLDDMWNESYGEWEVLKISFSVGAPGSQIIVTTRNSEVGNMICTVPFYTLKVLSDNDCWSVIESIAFPHSNSAALPELKKIGIEISKKCSGLPLAAITLGGLLRLKREDVKQWTFILKSELWDLPADNKMLPSLLVSYDHLPFEVKRCFVYCAVFPKGYRFQMEELVLLWLAEDLLPDDGGNEMEDVGRMYFYTLHAQSFLQPMGIYEEEFVMHDLMHDLAQFFSGEIGLHLKDNVDKGKLHEQCRRISHFRREDDVLAKFEPITSLKHLRSFLTLIPSLRNEFHHLSSDVLSVLPKFKKLRVLSLSGYLIDELPESIGSLRHLRYLNLSNSDIVCLPVATKNFYNLQTLILSHCGNLTSLIADIGSLTKLRHIDMVGTNLRLMPLRMGSLTDLQTLSDFVTGDKIGSGINGLQNLDHLQGKLHISGLQNVATSEDARDAVLSEKQCLRELILEWSSEDARDPVLLRERSSKDSEVLYELKPHANLQSLTITNFYGSKFPPWMCDSLFKSLESICIDRCHQCDTLTSFGQLPSLKKLVLKGLDKVEGIGDDLWGDSSCPFPSLQKLILQDMKNLCVWSTLGKNKMFTRLEELKIIDCPKLVKLTYCFPSLRILQVVRCGELTEIWKPFTEAGLLDDYKFLCHLCLVGCPKLKEIPKNIFELEILAIDGCDPELKLIRGDIIEDQEVNLDGCELSLSKLQKLYVSDSETKLLQSFNPRYSQKVLTRRASNLSVLGSWHAVSVFFTRKWSSLWKLFGYDSQRRLCALKLLELCDVRLVDTLPETLFQRCPKLEELKFFFCPNLVSLATEQEGEISGFPLLKRLTIKRCRVLQALPVKLVKFAPSIESLLVDDCESLANLSSDLHKLNSLQNLELVKCSMLEAFPDTGLPTTLERLNVRDCNSLTTFEGVMLSNCFSLEIMEIDRCTNLVSLGENEVLPFSLKHLKIGPCRSLLSLPQNLSESLNMNLIALEISDCNLVTSFPEGDLPLTLQRLVISGCDSLICLPHGINKLVSLRILEVSECPLIERFPNRGLPNSNLKSLTIKCCGKLMSLPNGFRKVGSLDKLVITDCPILIYRDGLPYNLMELTLKDCAMLLSSHPLQLDSLSLLQIVTLDNIPGSLIFSRDDRLPYSIIELNLRALSGLLSLPEMHDNLSKLKHLFIWECHELRSMPENGLPKTVAFLRVSNCRHLTPLCRGAYWTKIKMIPNVEIK